MAKTTVNNITVNVNNFQNAYTQLGLGNVPAGTTVDQAVSNIQNKLGTNLQQSWPASWPAYAAYQEDSAIMTPWSNNVPGTAPQCAIDAITQDFNNWELPVDSNAITNMVKEITQQIGNHGGQYATFYGRTPVSGAQTIYWGVAVVSAVVVDNPEQVGILYAFSAVSNV